MRSTQVDRDGTRIVSGRFNASGGVTSGSGFIITKSGPGAFHVIVNGRPGLISVVGSADSTTYYTARVNTGGFAQGEFEIDIFNSVTGGGTDVSGSFTATVKGN